MAITTVNQMIQGLLPPEDTMKIGATMEGTGILHTWWYSNGRPAAAAANSSGLAGAALTAPVAGQVPLQAPGGGKNQHLGRVQISTTRTGTLFLVDRLWHNSGISSSTTTAQTINSVAWPARDRDGTTAGDDVMVALEVSTTTGQAGAVTTITMSYTNQAGASGKTATISSFPATATAGTFIPFQLAAGDTGVRSIQSLTLGTTLSSGVVNLVAYNVLQIIPVPVVGTPVFMDGLTLGMSRWYDGAVPQLVWLPETTGGVTLSGQLTFTAG